MLMMNFEYSPKTLKIASLCGAIDAQVSDHKKDEEYKSSQGHSQSRWANDALQDSHQMDSHTHQSVAPVTFSPFNIHF